VSKSLKAACPVQDTQGAGVVMPAYEHTGVVKKNPLRYTPLATQYFWGKSCYLLSCFKYSAMLEKYIF
jgi:hypothetical protein